MTGTKERKGWDYEEVEVGQSALPTTTVVTEDSVSKWAVAVRSERKEYLSPAPGSLVAPAQIFGLAPKNRGGIAENNGFEIIDGHATPFAKCEGRWFLPVRVGDTITSAARVLEKYERRGNRFVTVRLEPTNQRDEKVAEIDHTSIFGWSKPDGNTANSARREPSNRSKSQVSVSQGREVVACVVEVDSIRVGDVAPALTVHSEPKAKDSKANSDGRFPWGAEHGVGGITIMGYIDEMLDQWVLSGSLYHGGRLLFKAIKNFRPGDTMVYSAVVCGKRREEGLTLVDFDVKGVNQQGQLTGVAEATVGVRD